MTIPGPCHFAIEAFDSLIGVECQNARIQANLNRYLFPPIPRTSPPPEREVDITIRVEASLGRFPVIFNGEPLVVADDLPAATLAVIKALDDAVVHRLRRFVAIHAGAVVIGGKALILPGSSHAGKSSLVAELLRRGAAHFSDEYALLDEQGLVHPYPRPLLLRQGSPSQTLVLPDELNSGFAPSPLAVAWILATAYDPALGWSVERLSQSEAVMELLENTPHEMGQSPGIVERCVRVAAGAECYRGTRGDVVEAASRIFELAVCS